MQVWIWFDMDGTIYHLYRVENWLTRLRDGDATVYDVPGKERRNLLQVRRAVERLREGGAKFGIISWTSKGADARYHHAITGVKLDWTERYFPELLTDNAFYCVPYGANKANIALAHDRTGIHFLLDDNADVRREWRESGDAFHTMNPARGLPSELCRWRK